MLSPGDQFEGYTVESVLGRGGYAVVYRAVTPPDGPARRTVALKVLDERHRRPADLARLGREFSFAQRIDHPHVVRMVEAGTYWLTMDFVDGATVGTLTDIADRLAALGQIADALDHIHRAGIVHCDVKPTNILVPTGFARTAPQRGGAVLIDFGVAHSLAEDVTKRPTRIEASLPYSAPELLHGKAPSAATDEYALACTAVELITGRPPFTAHTSMALMDAHLHRTPPRISREVSWVPHAVDSILSKALAKDPDGRYPSCTEFVSLITRALR